MPTNLTEVAQFTANVPAPNDGENANVASLIQALQPLADRTQYLNAAVAEGACIGRRLLYAPGDGTVMIGNIRVVLGGKLYALAAGNLGVAGLASNTTYYVYVYVSGGALVTEYVTTVPDDNLVFKSGAVTRRYVGTFRTDGAGAPIPMRYSDGRCTYRRSAVLGSPDVLGVLGSPTGVAWNTLSTWTDIPCSALVPAHARVAQLRGRINNSSGITTLEVRTKGDTTSAWSVAYVGAGMTEDFTVDLELNSSRVGEARMVDASSSVGQGASFYVSGFEE